MSASSTHVRSWFRRLSAQNFGGYLRFLRICWQVSRPLVTALLLDTAMMIVVPFAVIVVVGEVVSRLPAAVRSGLDSHDGRVVLVLALLAGGLVGVQWLAVSVREAICDGLNDRVNFQLQRDLMREVTRPPGLAHLEDAAAMDLIAVGRDTFSQWMRPGRLGYELTMLIPARGLLIGATVVLTRFSAYLGPLFLIAVLWTEQEGRGVARSAAETHYAATSAARRTQYFFTLGTEPGAGKEVRVFGLAGFILHRYLRNWATAHEAAFAGSRRREVLATAVLGGVCLWILGLLCYQAAQGRVSIGATAVYAQALLVGLTALGTTSQARVRTEMALATLLRQERAVAAVGADAEIPARVLPQGSPDAEIRFENVTFRYPGTAIDVLCDLSLVIPARQSLAIVGDNGVGKTTMLKLLCGLYPPTTGRILVDGVDLAAVDPRNWQRHVAAVFQDSVRFEVSAGMNVGFGAIEHSVDVAGVQRAAELAGVAELVASLDEGWDTVLSSQYVNGSDLSGGEWQKIALARALFAVQHGAGVLILDEPAANLDARSEARLYDRYLELTQGVTTIVVSHRFSTVRQATSILVLQDGQVAERGSHDELMCKGGRYAQMFNLQAASYEVDGTGEAAGAGR